MFLILLFSALTGSACRLSLFRLQVDGHLAGLLVCFQIVQLRVAVMDPNNLGEALSPKCLG
jgi:hypothetical protein